VSGRASRAGPTRERAHDQPRARQGRGAGGRRSGWPLLLILLAAAAAVGGYGWWGLGAPSDDPAPVEFEVLRGSGASRVARDLHAEGLIRDWRVFLLLLRVEGLDRRVGEGLYDLRRDMEARDVAAALALGGRPRTVRLVVPEGIRLRDVASRLEVAGLSPAGAALARMREPETLAPGFAAPASTLEGYLFPASYDVPVNDDLDTVLSRLVRRFEQELDGATRSRLDEAGLDVHTWVTLASMVQAEAANDDEMPIIAGVFLNRLDLGMPLQSDPTVAYGLDKDLPQLDFPGGDFDVDHPWNTYTRTGLPEGPIGNPGRAALESVLAPERTDDEGRAWLYFLHGRDESGPVFRPNLDFESHRRDVAEYLQR
jgi:UPF0755 protein